MAKAKDWILRTGCPYEY